MNHPVSKIFSIKLTAAIASLALSLNGYSEDDNETRAPTIEIFTTTQYSISGTYSHRSNQKAHRDHETYVIDRISQLENALSQELPNDPEKAKRLALKRIQSMNANISQQLENAAKGLAKAMQYGIHRYPAIVFDGDTVVYGVTDIEEATRYYNQWREEGVQ